MRSFIVRIEKAIDCLKRRPLEIVFNREDRLSAEGSLIRTARGHDCRWESGTRTLARHVDPALDITPADIWR